MKKERKVPTPWRDPHSGVFYLNVRVPKGLVAHFGKAHIQKSLRTKDRREAERKNCEEWLVLQRAFDKAQREQSLPVELSESLIPWLLEEWLFSAIREDEAERLQGITSRTNGNTFEAYASIIEELTEAQTTGQHPEWLQVRAGDILRAKGLQYSPDSLPFLKFLEALNPAFVRLLETQRARDAGRRVQSPEAPRVALTVSQLYEKFKSQRTGEKRWKDPETQDKREYGPIVREFISVIGDKPIQALTQQDTQKYYEHTLGRQDISMGTKKRNLTRIKTLLLYAKERHQVPDITGPLEMSTPYKKTHRSYERFTQGDLEALFHSEAYQQNTFKKASQYWLPLLGLYTGARIAEPASLLVSDLAQKDGIWCIHLSSEEANGGGKNAYAPRWVPIHPQLIKAGLLDYWETVRAEGHQRLFPELGEAARDGCGKRATADFTEYRRSVGVGESDTRSTKSYHSFRSTLVSELSERGVDGEMRRKIVGHSGRGDVHETVYDQSHFDPQRTLEAISLADFGLIHPPFMETEQMRKARKKHLRT